MDSSLRTWAVGVATALSVSAFGVASNLYVDVQLIKQNQTRLVEMSDQQKQMEQLINKLDKSLAVQAETLQTITKALEKSKR